MFVEVKGAVMATSPRVLAEQRDGEKEIRRVLGDEAAELLFENRRKRDGTKAHITILSPQDAKKAIASLAARDGISKGEAERRLKALAAAGVPDNFRVRGIGKAESGSKIAYFLVVDWPGGREFRESVGLDPDGQHFHVTLGFGPEGDVHGVPKNRPLNEGQLAVKQSNLRSQIIRLAHAKPELRPTLLPLLKEAVRGLGPMPRSSYLPKDNETLARVPGMPEGLEVFTYERATPRGMFYYGIAFAGRAQKPLWHYSYKDPARRDSQIRETAKSIEARAKAKAEKREQRKQFTHGLQVGDVLYSSWGYDQTNIDWFQVVGAPTEKTVLIREIASKTARSTGYGQDYVVPVPGKFVGPVMKKIPKGDGKYLSVKIDNVRTAWKWDGKPKQETSSGWGH
jgi:hypothetical protein